MVVKSKRQRLNRLNDDNEILVNSKGMTPVGKIARVQRDQDSVT